MIRKTRYAIKATWPKSSVDLLLNCGIQTNHVLEGEGELSIYHFYNMWIKCDNFIFPGTNPGILKFPCVYNMYT